MVFTLFNIVIPGSIVRRHMVVAIRIIYRMKYKSVSIEFDVFLSLYRIIHSSMNQHTRDRIQEPYSSIDNFS